MTSEEEEVQVRICEVDDMKTGKQHEWSYSAPWYTCLKCGAKVKKEDLKTGTD